MSAALTIPTANRASGWTDSSRQGANNLRRILERLASEFESAVGILDRATKRWVETQWSENSEAPDPAAFSETAAPVSVVRVHGESGRKWLVLQLSAWRVGDVCACISFRDEPTGAAEDCNRSAAILPDRALLAWGQAVVDRHRELGESRRGSPTEALIRRFRVSESPERFQRRATAAVREALNVEAAAWVPPSSREPVVVSGAVAALTGERFRALIPRNSNEAVLVCNQPEAVGVAGTGLTRFAAAAADADGPAGWLIAANPRDGRPFTTEIELLQSVAPLIATQRANARLYSDVKDLLFGVVRSLTAAIDAKDPYTSGHSERVARIAVRLGEELGMSPNERGDLYLMGLLHDVGKIGIDDQVLKKPGKLTQEEYLQIQSHVRIGVHILSDLKKLQHLLPGVASHHECVDGSGYPLGLSGDSIPLHARILAVADGFDAMSSSRPYRRKLTQDQISDIFREGSGAQWDPIVVKALFACREDLVRIQQKGIGESLKEAVDDTIGRVLPDSNVRPFRGG